MISLIRIPARAELTPRIGALPGLLGLLGLLAKLRVAVARIARGPASRVVRRGTTAANHGLVPSSPPRYPMLSQHKVTHEKPLRD